MTKNAFEAISKGETVNLSFERREGIVVFLVQNPGVIAKEVGLQIFQRSFTTKKSKGHGIGKYSMNLFGERYLGG